MSAAADINCALRQRVDPQTGEPLFTLEQVKDIVRRAVDEKERQIRVQYDAILQQKLQGEARRDPPPHAHRPRGPLVLQQHIRLPPQPAHPRPPARAEQYQAFAKFNEDYISRSLKTKCAPRRPCFPASSLPGASVRLRARTSR